MDSSRSKEEDTDNSNSKEDTADSRNKAEDTDNNRVACTDNSSNNPDLDFNRPLFRALPTWRFKEPRRILCNNSNNRVVVEDKHP